MLSNKLSIVAASAVAIATIGGGAAVAAQSVQAAPTTTQAIYQQDFSPQSPAGYGDTRSSGSYGFGPRGLTIETKDATSNAKVAEYFAPVTSAFPLSGSYAYDGTSSPSGANVSDQVIFHQAGMTDYNVLVGEQIYSTNTAGDDLTDWWATSSSKVFAKTTDAQGNVVPGPGNLCPVVGGGSGSLCHGTLQQWAAKVPGAGVNVVGFSLGSGVQAEGVLASTTFDGVAYTYTAGAAPAAATSGGSNATQGSSTAATREDVSGLFTAKQRLHRVIINLAANKLTSGATQGKQLVWTVKVNGSSVTTYSQDAGQVNTAQIKNRKHARSVHHRKVVKLYKNGVKVAVFVIVPRPPHHR